MKKPSYISAALPQVLIIDDEENMLHMLAAMLGKNGYDVTVSSEPQQGVQLIRNGCFDFVLCDVKMPGMDGIEVLESLAGMDEMPTIIMMSAYGSIDLAISAMKAGAYDFISKPFKKDEVLLALKKAEEREGLRKENRILKEEIKKVRGKSGFGRMLWASKKMDELVQLARKVAAYDSPVLITGESGTGKELMARGIHQCSARAERAFQAINCGSIPAGLIENELFGHVRGAFTGADRTKCGVFEAADSGTLFLDEIGELPIDMQVKLLRVLQEQEIRPVGGNTNISIDVRVLAATSRDIASEIRDGRFREDLYYRLNVIHLELPALRSRTEDIPVLCQGFLDKFTAGFNKKVDEIEAKAMEKMLAYPWPGNVRELENTIQRAVIIADEQIIGPEHIILGPAADRDGGNVIKFSEENCSLKEAKKRLEKSYIEKALHEAGGNKSKAARRLELSYPALLNKIKEYRLG
ncbi:MAG: hypothetical protein CSB24_03995 [Deltaproteobacteria bacterium]|nr:MAG: hypothetical protein CSB24_03995 [Deltaproteobacteria bacterium]